jgi:hypothetical protein
MALMEFGFGAYFWALLCVIISSLALCAFFFKSLSRWLSLTYKACVYLFNQLHSNIFLANSLEEPDVLLGKLERGNKPEQDKNSWYGLSWPFGRRGQEYSRKITLSKLMHRRQNSGHGVVEPVAKSSPNGKTDEPGWKGSVGKMQGKKGKHKSKH